MIAEKFDLLSASSEEMKAFVLSLGQRSYRAEQIYRAAVAGVPFASMSVLPTALRAELERKASIDLPKIERKIVSALDGTLKYLFSLQDGERIETVLMRYEHGISVCLSTQAGCNMGCVFCASTIGGKRRNLTASEIIGQVIAASLDSGERIGGAVLMGIGEPLDNYDAVIRFLRRATEERSLGIGARHISLSTCGIADRIYDLARENFAITLSISLHAVNDVARSAIMPINKRYDLNSLLTACREYFEVTGRRISFEYALISGVNDSVEDAETLAAILFRYMKRHPFHVNLIPVNGVAERGALVPPDRTRVNAFCAALNAKKINVTVRRKLGGDIDASCGQLRAESGSR